MTASLSMSMPHSEAAPKAPAAARTTPLPQPISRTSAPRIHAALARNTWINAAVYSLGRNAAAGPLNPLDGCNACKPPEHFGGYRIFRKFGEDFVIALECQSRIVGDQSLIGLA